MEHLRYLERPELRKPRWVSAFAGWADAQEGASRTIRYMIEQLPAKKFAEIDAEEFYDFTAVRPVAYNNAQGQRIIRWPANEFFYYSSPDGGNELLIFLGTEPSLKWRTYIGLLLEVMDPYDIEAVLNLGSLMDAIPHTRDATLSGGANKPELRERLAGLRIMGTGYQGPVGITSVLMDACTRRGLDYLSLWGHAPHYVQRTPNYKVCRALVARLNQLLGLTLPLEELDRRAKVFEAEVTKAISSSVEVSTYVKQLERQYDAAVAQSAQLPSPESIVQELEEFLKKDKPGGQPPSTN